MIETFFFCLFVFSLTKCQSHQLDGLCFFFFSRHQFFPVVAIGTTTPTFNFIHVTMFPVCSCVSDQWRVLFRTPGDHNSQLKFLSAAASQLKLTSAALASSAVPTAMTAFC